MDINRDVRQRVARRFRDGEREVRDGDHVFLIKTDADFIVAAASEIFEHRGGLCGTLLGFDWSIEITEEPAPPTLRERAIVLTREILGEVDESSEEFLAAVEAMRNILENDGRFVSSPDAAIYLQDV